ncbi:MAG: TIGR00730 family Rossman fold protein [Alphaproteobacteria bacterium]|nr:TIGR00730 family Rossman fold protein [Alphaproteobacteria bacterium]MBV9542743.1 TIGR00730 family Rossman fold protein [Alphaproteobacteria bacterium]MBV9903762.1 TIGR00730 family Rossman fold protein [Alphaproteobacteria bacterium]
MDKNKATICVFCGSSSGTKEAYARAAQRLGSMIGEHGYDMVFGGGRNGLMGIVATAAHAAGAKVLGVLPGFLKQIEIPLEPESEELVIVPDMQIRKQMMLAKSDAFVILPGGLGTLDELFEVLSIAQLRVHSKPIVVMDTEGFYEPLWPMLSRIVREGFALRSIESLYHVVKTPDEAIAKLDALLRDAP